MAITSWPFETDDTTEVQYAKLLDALQETGVVNGLAVTAGTGMSINIAAGAALIKGTYLESTATEARTVSGAHATQQRLDYLIVKRNLSTNAVTLEVKAGTPTSGGGTLPSLQQDDSIWEHPIAVITVPAGATNIVSGNISERRAALSRGFVLYANSTQRPAPVAGRTILGINTTSGVLEASIAGAAWAGLGVAWDAVSGKPATYPPTIGSGAGDAVAGNDARLTNKREPTVHGINSTDHHSGFPLSLANGGTGASDAVGARTALGGTATGVGVFTAASVTAAREALRFFLGTGPGTPQTNDIRFRDA